VEAEAPVVEAGVVEAEEPTVEAEAPAVEARAVEAEAPAGRCWMGLAAREVEAGAAEGGAVLDWGWWRTGRCWTGRRPRHRSGGQRTSAGWGVEIRGEAEAGAQQPWRRPRGGARGRRPGRRSLGAAGARVVVARI
jgi:hypothetical protein